MEIYKSRFTPGATGDEIKLELGEVVKYKFPNGETQDVRIISGRMKHDDCPNLGYEAIEAYKPKTPFFINGKTIIWWEGKVESENKSNVIS